MEHFDLDHSLLQIKTSAAEQVDQDSWILVNFTVGQPDRSIDIVLQRNETEPRLTLKICSEEIAITNKVASDLINFNQENIWTFKKTVNSLELLHGDPLTSLVTVDVTNNKCKNLWAKPATKIIFHDSESSPLQFRRERTTCYDTYVKEYVLKKYCSEITKPSQDQYECGQQALSSSVDGYFAWYKNMENITSCWVCPNSEDPLPDLSNVKSLNSTFLVQNSCVGRFL